MPKTLRPRSKPRRKGEKPSEDEYSIAKALRKIQQQEREASEKRAAQAEAFFQPIKNVTSALEESVKQVPFTGEEYQQAAESQRQDKVQKWHDIETGMEAALMAQLGTDLAGPLLRYGWNALKNKAISPAARIMMNPENFTFEGPLIKPAKLNIAEEPIASEPLGSIAQTLFTKPRLSLPQPKQRLGLPAYEAKGNLDTAPQDAGLYDQTDGDLFGIKLVDTALKPRVTVSPHSLPTDFMEHHTGNSVNSVVDNIYNVWNRNYPLWESEGIKPPLPFITSIGDDVMSVGFRPQWYKMIDTPGDLERMASFAGPTRNKLIANLSPEAKTVLDARGIAPVDLFNEWLGPEARSPRQIAIDDEIAAMNKNWEDRVLFDTNVNNLYNNKLITPRHRAALLNSDEPLKYFGNAVQHNIMKKAAQNYFKDIKTAKQKDYARRLMTARKQEAEINWGLNDTANAAYRDLQGSIQPPASMNKQIADANHTIGQIRSIGDIVEDTFNNYQAWKADPNPAGWQLKSLMQGSKIEKQLSKDGTVAVSNLRNTMKDASGVEKEIVEKVLSEKFAGQTKVNYVDLKHAVQEELPVYQQEHTHAYEDYGLGNIGYSYDKYVRGSITVGDLEREFPGRFVTTRDPFFKITDTKTGKVLQSQEDLDEYVDLINSRNNVQLDTYTFSSPRIPYGNNRHYAPNTLGHSRTFISNEEPDVMHVMESQSDWGQQYKNLHKAYGSSNDKIHAEYLSKNWESRQIQENMMHASNKGLTKMRYPTEETAAKIEGYSKIKRPPHNSVLKQLRDDIKQKTSQLNIESEVGINYEGGISGMSYHKALRDPALPDEIKQMIRKYNQLSEEYIYPEEYQTILRKYSEFPKKFKKIYKNQEVREVTDSKGNTWYEVDVPKDIRKRERAYSITGTAIAGGTTAATLKPLKRDK